MKQKKRFRKVVKFDNDAEWLGLCITLVGLGQYVITSVSEPIFGVMFPLIVSLCYAIALRLAREEYYEEIK